MFDLEERRALVTGATGGIGASIVSMLHMQGATVVLSGSREETLREQVDTLGSRAHAVPCDLRNPGTVESLLTDSIGLMGGIDILVHCAGITRDNLAMRMKDAEWQDVIDINLGIGFRLARASLRGMIKARWGRIIYITSIVGSTGNPGQTNYAASKAGLTGMAKSLASEVANRGITVNCIAPGFIKTPMTDSLSDIQMEKIKSSIPASQIGKAADIGAGCVYLASEEAAYVTGQTLHINGGMAML